MPHYYFDIRENDLLTVDEEGIDLPSLAEARREAHKALADMAADVFRRHDQVTLSIAIREPDGRCIEAVASASVREI